MINYFWVIIGLIAAYLNNGILPINEEAFIALSSIFFFSCLYILSRKNASNLFFLQADTVYLIFGYLMKLNIHLLRALNRLYFLVSMSKRSIRFNITRNLLFWRSSLMHYYAQTWSLLILKNQFFLLIKSITAK